MAGISVILFVLACAVSLAYVFYRASFPRPLPGIPYSKDSIRPFGDIPDMLKSREKTQEAMGFILGRCDELQSPIFQISVEIFRKPWVVIADSLTTEHILSKRTAEFDLSPLFSDVFRAIAPDAMVVYKTSTSEWKMHRRLMADTMSTKFLNGVAAAQILSACDGLVELWFERMRHAQGHPFHFGADVLELMMDAIWGSAFGQSLGTFQIQKAILAEMDLMEVPDSPEEPAIFKSHHKSEAYEAMALLGDSSEIPLKMPTPRYWTHKIALVLYPSLRKAFAYKNRYIKNKLQQAWERFSSTDDLEVKCAADFLVEREVSLATKEQRQPNYDSSMVKDELYGFLFAGHETTATTLQWALKLLTLHQDVQQKLRQALNTAFNDSSTTDAAQIASADLPYLDACIYEILRVGSPVVILLRETQKDCEVLGYQIPAKTQILLPVQGPGYRQPRLDFDSDIKDPFTGNWQPESLHLFQPERWLINGKFDARAGPLHAFGTGTRACFGRRLALLSLRMVLTSLILNFKLQPIPENLANFRAVDVLTHRPQQTYIRLAKA